MFAASFVIDCSILLTLVSVFLAVSIQSTKYFLLLSVKLSKNVFAFAFSVNAA